MPKRSSSEGSAAAKVVMAVSMTPTDKLLFEEEASHAHQTVSGFICNAVHRLIEAPRYGGMPLLPSSGFMVLPVGPEEYIFVPRNWGAAELRRAAAFYEGLSAATDTTTTATVEKP